MHRQNTTGQLLVIGVMFELRDNSPKKGSAWLEQLVPYLDQHRDNVTAIAASNNVTVNAQTQAMEQSYTLKKTLKLANFWEQDVNGLRSGYYAYVGSLTTPPCSPGVQWIVAADRAPISVRQYNALREQLGFNARAPQPIRNA